MKPQTSNIIPTYQHLRSRTSMCSHLDNLYFRDRAGLESKSDLSGHHRAKGKNLVVGEGGAVERQATIPSIPRALSIQRRHGRLDFPQFLCQHSRAPPDILIFLYLVSVLNISVTIADSR